MKGKIVDEQHPIPNLHGVAGQANEAFHENGGRAGIRNTGIPEDHDIAPAGNEDFGKQEHVHENIVSRKERSFHREGGDADGGNHPGPEGNGKSEREDSCKKEVPDPKPGYTAG